MLYEVISSIGFRFLADGCAAGGWPKVMISSTLLLAGTCSIFLIGFSLNQPIKHVPRLSSAACRQKCSAAIAMSICEKALRLIMPPSLAVNFCRCDTTATSTGARCANPFIANALSDMQLASFSFSSGRSIIMNFQGCELHAEGASRAASMHLTISSLLTGVSL